MKLSEFDYYLPKELIAQRPLDRRDSSRLMIVDRKHRTISHKSFRDIAEYFQQDDLLVFNDAKVIPARMLGRKANTLGKVDVLLTNRLSKTKFQALLNPNIRPGREIIFDHGEIKARMLNEKMLEFNKPISHTLLEKIGLMPLPPYIKRTPSAQDVKRYQTVYARKPGAIASPTAGLHFTKKLLNEIKTKSAHIAYLTLHVGVGTFKPVKCDDIRNHIMEKEAFSIPEQTINLIRFAKEKGKRIFAVGTTTARAIESSVDLILDLQTHDPRPMTHDGFTDLFIYPGYKFKVVDCLLTNFHLPKTTLLMLVCAFAGRDLVLQAYQEAVKERYRFYSYGDAMLII